jgi:DNA-binding response OmpR family regulator
MAPRRDIGSARMRKGPLVATVPPSREAIQIANLEIRPAEFQLLADGHRVGMTVREFQTFYVLAERRNRVITRPEIYKLVWGGEMAYRDRSVDVFVRKARQKLAAAAPEWTYIHTHFGVGYRFQPEQIGGALDESAAVVPLS